MPRSNIFVLGLDESNRAVLEAMPGAEQWRFHQLLTLSELKHGHDIPVPELIEAASKQLDDFPGSIDAVIGFWDFPVTMMVPILCKRFGLRSASLQSVLKCEHKYWSRLLQAEVVDEVPRFAVVDLSVDEPQPPDFGYPLWLKPVKSFASQFSYRVTDDASFRVAAQRIGANLDRIGRPFQWMMDMVERPDEVRAAAGLACLAEEPITGLQATVEGYRAGGNTTVYGIVDSPFYPGTTTFLRYQYPSTLPADVQARMADISKRVIEHIGLDQSTFNVEFFWDPDTDAVRLLEINPRHSQSHARLFADVDGMANHWAMVQIALGGDPTMPRGQGPWATSAKCFVRSFARDGVVRRAPTREEIIRCEREVPGAHVEVVAHEGDRLSQLRDQDAYSYQLATVTLGGADTDDLVARYERCLELLCFEIDEGA